MIKYSGEKHNLREGMLERKIYIYNRKKYVEGVQLEAGGFA